MTNHTPPDIDDIVLGRLSVRIRSVKRAVMRIGFADVVGPDSDLNISVDAWDAAIERLIDTARVLMYKINDLPSILPLSTYAQTGYTTPEHLLGLLKGARPEQAEEILAYLEFHGVAVPQSMEPCKVTDAEKKRINSAVRSLNKIRAEVAERNPAKQVTWYLDGSQGLHLMIEPKGQMNPDQQYIAHDVRLAASGGGDW